MPSPSLVEDSPLSSPQLVGVLALASYLEGVPGASYLEVDLGASFLVEPVEDSQCVVVAGASCPGGSLVEEAYVHGVQCRREGSRSRPPWVSPLEALHTPSFPPVSSFFEGAIST